MVEMDTLVALCKRRGFVFQNSEIYGGINGFWDFGPVGCELKNRIKEYTLSGSVIYQFSFRVENIREGVKLWEDYTKKAFSIDKSPDRPVLHIRYEDFVDNPEKYMAKISTFVGLELNREHMKQVTSALDQDRKWAFVKDDELVRIYSEIQDRELVIKCGYHEIV